MYGSHGAGVTSYREMRVEFAFISETYSLPPRLVTGNQNVDLSQQISLDLPPSLSYCDQNVIENPLERCELGPILGEGGQ